MLVTFIAAIVLPQTASTPWLERSKEILSALGVATPLSFVRKQDANPHDLIVDGVGNAYRTSLDKHGKIDSIVRVHEGWNSGNGRKTEQLRLIDWNPITKSHLGFEDPVFEETERVTTIFFPLTKGGCQFFSTTKEFGLLIKFDTTGNFLSLKEPRSVDYPSIATPKLSARDAENLLVAFVASKNAQTKEDGSIRTQFLLQGEPQLHWIKSNERKLANLAYCAPYQFDSHMEDRHLRGRGAFVIDADSGEVIPNDTLE